MKVRICGIDYKIKFTDDPFGADTNFGQLDFSKAEITINKSLCPEIIKETMIHEVIHAILRHIGRLDLTEDETFTQGLANAMYQSFELRIEDSEEGLFR